MRGVVVWGIRVLLIATMGLAFGMVVSSTPKHHSPYASTMNLGVGVAHAQTCEDKTCIQANILPVQCAVAVGENCACQNCGNPVTGMCVGELCE